MKGLDSGLHKHLFTTWSSLLDKHNSVCLPCFKVTNPYTSHQCPCSLLVGSFTA